MTDLFPRQIGVIFPGQGSQSIGMSSVLDRQQSQPLFDQASAILGYDLLDIITHGSAEILDRTEITQPALLVTSVALWQEKFCQNIHSTKPLVLAGHSLGEYTALVCAGALTFSEAVYLVSERGKLMQTAVPEGQGAMAAVIGLTYSQVSTLCQDILLRHFPDSPLVLACANINSPEQIVVAGHAVCIERALSIFKQAGAKLVKTLSVSVPSHCLLMQPAAERLKLLLTQCQIRMPAIPVLHNIHASICQDSEAIRQALVDQLFHPVQWAKIIQTMVQSYAVEQIIECGPNKVLTGLNKRMLPESVSALSVSSMNI